jgi:lysozyme
MVKGIDVSSNNGKIDWPTVAHDLSIKFAFVKVSEGDWHDPRAAENVSGARHAGLLVGGYAFVRPKAGRTGAEEFDLFRDRAAPMLLFAPGRLRPVIDIEATKLDAAGTREYVRSWVQRCFKVTRRHPIIYTGKWFYEGPGMREMRHRWGCALWLAAYTEDWRQHIPAAWHGHASFHQYTDKGRVAGISGNVDMNHYLSSLHNLKRSHTL